MRITPFLLSVMFCTLQANDLYDPYNMTYTTILHSEYEKSLGKKNNTSFPTDSNSYISWFNEIDAQYDINDEFYISAGAKANIVLTDSPYTTPYYLQTKLFSEEIDRSMISEASINYDNGYFSFSVGRNEVDYDWLFGSIDGAIASVGSDETLSLRLFWFQDFTQLQYNYYVSVNDINENEGMYGAILKAKKESLELTLYDYFMSDLRNMLGGHIDYTQDTFALNLSYTETKALSLALYDYDESLIQSSIEWLWSDDYFEVGGSLTGENGLIAMVQLGSFMTGRFYLKNQIDRENAKNIYGRYIHVADRWTFEFLGGYSEYDNSYVAIADDLSSYEVDAYVGYRIADDWSVSLGAMYMDVDDADPISVDQFLSTFNLRYRYELF